MSVESWRLACGGSRVIPTGGTRLHSSWPGQGWIQGAVTVGPSRQPELAAQPQEAGPTAPIGDLLDIGFETSRAEPG